MILQQIKDSLLLARKSKDTKKLTFFSTLLGEMERKSKSVTDDEALSVIRKSIKNQEEILVVKPDCEQSKFELSLLSSFLPKGATEEEIIKLIKTEKESGNSDFGSIVKNLKLKLGSGFNGKVVSNLVKQYL